MDAMAPDPPVGILVSLDAVKVPGKTASGLWWYWDSPMQRMNLSLSLIYRKAEMARVECQG